MTKAERILELYETGQYSTRQIADMVGCLPAYVRVVARQRKGRISDIDARYWLKRFGGRTLIDVYRNKHRHYRAGKTEARAS